MENKTTIQIDVSTKNLLDEIKTEIQEREENINNKPIYENLDYNAVVWILANEFKENRK